MKHNDRALTNFYDPYLRSSIDFKQIGNQFIVGKPNPKLTSTHETRFQKIYSDRLKQLHPDKAKASRELTYKQLKDMHNELSISKKSK
jgi:hypothetical protein